MNENSHSDESMILKRDDRLLIDLDSSKGGLIGKSSKDSKDLQGLGAQQINDDYYQDVGFDDNGEN